MHCTLICQICGVLKIGGNSTGRDPLLRQRDFEAIAIVSVFEDVEAGEATEGRLGIGVGGDMGVALGKVEQQGLASGDLGRSGACEFSPDIGEVGFAVIEGFGDGVL